MGQCVVIFPTGEDPLSEQRYDLDSVAGVLKLYFRCLENPLFPTESTSQLLQCSRKRFYKRKHLTWLRMISCFVFHCISSEIKDDAERAAQLNAIVSSYPEPVIVVMRYLFAFLHQ